MKTTRSAMAAAVTAAVLVAGAAGVAAAGGRPDVAPGGPDWAGQGMQNGAGPMRQGRGPGGGRGGCLSDPAAPLTAEQTSTLLHMREEEQLAHDLYVAFAEQWDNEVFDRIARSESRHIDAVQRLLDRHGLQDPSPGPGFADDGLQALWDELLAKGMTSQDAALEVGRTVETTDIADLAAALEAGQPVDVAKVYEHLQRASERHLAAFGG